MEYTPQNKRKLVKKNVQKYAEKPLYSSSGPPKFTRVSVNIQRVFIRHYMYTVSSQFHCEINTRWDSTNNDQVSLDQWEASVCWKINGAWSYPNHVRGSLRLRWVHTYDIDAMWWAVVDVIIRNLLTNMWPVFRRKSLECDSVLTRCESHLDEFTDPIWKQ